MKEITQTGKLRYSDVFGAAASGLCAIHCALTPMFFAARPVLENTIERHHHGPGIWAFLDYIFLVLSLAAVWYSARHTFHKGIKWILWLACGVFTFGLLSELFHFAYGKWFMYIGSFVLIIAHVFNHQYCKKSMTINTSENLNHDVHNQHT